MEGQMGDAIQSADAMMEGQVKSWNGAKGFGFVSCEGFAGDIFFSRNELPPDHREVDGHFMNGRQVLFNAQEGPDGRMKATRVQITPVEGASVAGCVKSFSQKNGYGFITSTSLEQDVRFQVQDLPPQMQGAFDLASVNVTFTLLTLPDGKLRASQIAMQPGKGCGKGAAMQMQPIAMQMHPMHQQSFARHPMQQQFAPQWSPPMQQQWSPPMFAACKGGGKGCGKMSSTMSGTVKSFSDKNGYGFITIPGRPDIKFGMGDLVGAPTVAAGTTVTFQPHSSLDGRLQAQQVQPVGVGGGNAFNFGGVKRPLEFPNGKGGGMMGGGFGGNMAAAKRPRPSTTPATGPGGAEERWVTGSVKSFNPTKGFGFLVSDELPSDAFFMKQALPPDLQFVADGNQLAGLAATFKLCQTPDGKLRAESITIMQ
jgi:cold shock CspA family protein